jgi:hypothetical protein
LYLLVKDWLGSQSFICSQCIVCFVQDNVQFTLIGINNDMDFFSIDSTTGIVRVAKNLRSDVAQRQRYTVGLGFICVWITSNFGFGFVGKVKEYWLCFGIMDL